MFASSNPQTPPQIGILVLQRMESYLIVALCIATLAFSSAAFAHHWFAMFDHNHQFKLVGTVKYFQWTNPHVYIKLLANIR